MRILSDFGKHFGKPLNQKAFWKNIEGQQPVHKGGSGGFLLKGPLFGWMEFAGLGWELNFSRQEELGTAFKLTLPEIVSPNENEAWPKCVCVCVCVHALSCVWLFGTPWTVACQSPLSMGILQARILEWVAMLSSRGSSQPRDWTQVSRIAGGFFTSWASREAPPPKCISVQLLPLRCTVKEGREMFWHFWYLLLAEANWPRDLVDAVRRVKAPRAQMGLPWWSSG